MLDAVRATSTLDEAAQLLGYRARHLSNVIIDEGLEEQVRAIRGGSMAAKKPRPRAQIVDVIRTVGGEVGRAAHVLGLSRNRLYLRINAEDLWPVVEQARATRRARGLIGAAQKELSGHG